MDDDHCLVFVEVRFRRSADFVAPGITVDRRKQRRIIRAAALYLARSRRFADAIVRFDVVALEGEDAERIVWIQDAFRPEDSSL